MLWKPRTNDIEEMTDIYYQALKKFSEKNLLRAAESCMNELEFYPKPIDLTKRLPKGNTSMDESAFKIKEGVTCGKCGLVTMCIEEPTGCSLWRCRKCYTGMSVPQIQQKLRDLVARMGG